MFNAKNKGISFESITRCRRKLQEKNPELRDEETFKMRNKKQKEYIKYSKQSKEVVDIELGSRKPTKCNRNMELKIK